MHVRYVFNYKDVVARLIYGNSPVGDSTARLRAANAAMLRRN